ncbi:MAG: DNA methyltransferase, partial [Candidatus Methanofastidiosia archaeon]
MVGKKIRVVPKFEPNANVVLFPGDTLDLLKQIPDKTASLVVTSPPYNLGKPYEEKLNLQDYITQQEEVIKESIRITREDGSICWQV